MIVPAPPTVDVSDASSRLCAPTSTASLRVRLPLVTTSATSPLPLPSPTPVLLLASLIPGADTETDPTVSAVPFANASPLP